MDKTGMVGQQALERVMDYHLARHNVLVSNLANADTPGFKTQELLFEDELNGVMQMDGDAPGHVRAEASALTLVEVESEAAQADGNGVRVEESMAKIAANRLRYEAAVELMRRQLGLMRYASTNGDGG